MISAGVRPLVRRPVWARSPLLGVFLGAPGTGKTHLSIALGVEAARRGQRVALATAHQRVNRLGAAKRAGRLDEELERLSRDPAPHR